MWDLAEDAEQREYERAKNKKWDPLERKWSTWNEQQRTKHRSNVFRIYLVITYLSITGDEYVLDYEFISWLRNYLLKQEINTYSDYEFTSWLCIYLWQDRNTYLDYVCISFHLTFDLCFDLCRSFRSHVVSVVRSYSHRSVCSACLRLFWFAYEIWKPNKHTATFFLNNSMLACGGPGSHAYNAPHI